MVYMTKNGAATLVAERLTRLKSRLLQNFKRQWFQLPKEIGILTRLKSRPQWLENLL